jgi:hypothetical protein
VTGSDATVEPVTVDGASAASESFPAHTPAPMTAARTAPATATGTHLAASLDPPLERDDCVDRPLEARELDERAV